MASTPPHGGATGVWPDSANVDKSQVRAFLSWMQARLSGAIFDTVADMVAATGLGVGDQLSTLGYTSASDGGGAFYEVVAAGTGSADGGNFIDLAGSAMQARAVHFAGAVSPMQFGANGDGVTSDNAALDLVNNAAFRVVDLDGRDFEYTGNFIPLASVDFINGRIIDDAATHDFRSVTKDDLTAAIAALETSDLTVQNVLNVASVEVIWAGQSPKRVTLDLDQILPVTDGAVLELEVTTDGGATWKQGASDYSWAVGGAQHGTQNSETNRDLSDNSILVTRGLGIGNDIGELGLCGAISIQNPSLPRPTAVTGYAHFKRENGVEFYFHVRGFYLASDSVNGVRFRFSTGNIASAVLASKLDL